MWDQKCLIWVFLNQNSLKTRFVKIENLKNLGPKMNYFGVVGSNFEKLLLYLKSPTLKVSFCKFGTNLKIL